MNYFSDLEIGFSNHLPQCRAWIDRTHPYYAINYAHSGRIWWSMNEKASQALVAPVAWWTVPDVHYIYGNFEGESWDHSYVTFSGARAEKYSRAGLFPNEDVHFCPISNSQCFMASMQELLQAIESDAIKSARTAWLLEGLLLQLHEQEAQHTVTVLWYDEIQVLMQKIAAQPQHEWNSQQIAQKLGISPIHLRRVFKRVAGISPRQFVIKARLDGAARELRATSHPVKTIALRYGFYDLPYFSKLFSKHYGFSPNLYRKETQLRF